MDCLVIPAPTPTLIPVAGGGLFPVRRVYCVGRNYEAHTREMGGDPHRDPPFFFAKPADAVTSLSAVPYPPATARLDHEGELVVAIGRGGATIAAADALGHVFGYAAGCDLTRRDLQAEAKKQGRPWETGKGFDLSGPIGEIAPAARIGHPAAGRIRLTVNGETRQQGDLAQMIWPVGDIIAALSALFTLAPGDLIYTGTPAGVGPLTVGDAVEVTVEGLAPCRFAIV